MRSYSVEYEKEVARVTEPIDLSASMRSYSVEYEKLPLITSRELQLGQLQ